MLAVFTLPHSVLIATLVSAVSGTGALVLSAPPAQAATVSAASINADVAADVALIPAYYRELNPGWTWSIGPESSDPCAAWASSYTTPIAGCTTSATTTWFSDDAEEDGPLALEDVVAHEFFNALSFAIVSPGDNYDVAGSQPWAEQFAQLDVGMDASTDVDAFAKCMTQTVLGVDVEEGDAGECPANLGGWVVASLQAEVSSGQAASAASSASPRFVGIAAGPAGPWAVTSNGVVSALGNATFYGDLATSPSPVVGIVATPDGGGYWLVDTAGDVSAFGDARSYGSLAGTTLNAPIVGMAATADGRGYWLVGADGGIFSFGDATFHGSTGGMTLNAPITAMAADPDSDGYWLVAADGGIFSFGAPFEGSTGGMTLNAPVVGMAASPDGNGYALVSSDGGVFSFGDSTFYGSLGASPPADGVTSLGVAPGDDGYYLVGPAGEVYGFGPGAPY
jgi:hypothetical protein